MALSQFSLSWNNHSQQVICAIENLKDDQDFTDCTLSCEGQRIKCHKVLLSACSSYFKETFKENLCPHPIIIIKGVTFEDLQAAVTFMYNGQVNISQDRLPTFLQVAELLKIRGLETGDSAKKRGAADTPSHSQQTKSSENNTESDRRSPTLKRKRIGPASFMNKQKKTVDSQVPSTSSAAANTANTVISVDQVGSETASSSNPTNNTGAFITPEEILIPDASSSNESYAHIKFEDEEDTLGDGGGGNEDEEEVEEFEDTLADNDSTVQELLGDVDQETGTTYGSSVISVVNPGQEETPPAIIVNSFSYQTLEQNPFQEKVNDFVQKKTFRAKNLFPSRQNYEMFMSVLKGEHVDKHVRKSFVLQTNEDGEFLCSIKDHKRILCSDDFSSVMEEYHDKTNHTGRDLTVKKVQNVYHYVPRSLVQEYIYSCPICIRRRSVLKKD